MKSLQISTSPTKICRYANHFFDSDPGLSWKKDDGVILRSRDGFKVLTPNLVPIADSRWRLYFTGGSYADSRHQIHGKILSAVSEDLNSWSMEEGVRIKPFGPLASRRVVSPDIVLLPNGHYRCYVQVHSHHFSVSSIASAYSRDGIFWIQEREYRIHDEKASLGSPRCIPLASGGYRLYYHSYPHPFREGLQAKNNILSAHSEDGLKFTPEEGVRIEQTEPFENYAVYASDVIHFQGQYRMYYGAWDRADRGRICAAHSEDGIHWIKDGICLPEGGELQENIVSEPCVAPLKEGGYRMFYEARDQKGTWRILSATSNSNTN